MTACLLQTTYASPLDPTLHIATFQPKEQFSQVCTPSTCSHLCLQSSPPAQYNFGYAISNTKTGDSKSRQETR